MIDLAGLAIWLRTAEPGEQPEAGPTRRHFGYDHLGLSVNNLQQAYQELSAKGYAFPVPPAGPDARIAFLRGPDNIGIELFQPPS
jgi:catechol 2,3-dioxygenase-like lactoylglutathione lyase family enzyme